MPRRGNLEKRFVLAVVHVRNPERSGDLQIGHLEQIFDALLRIVFKREEAALLHVGVLEKVAAFAVHGVGAGLLHYDESAGSGVAEFGRHGAADYLDFLIAHGDGVDGSSTVHAGGEHSIFILGGLVGVGAIKDEIAQSAGPHTVVAFNLRGIIEDALLPVLVVGQIVKVVALHHLASG